MTDRELLELAAKAAGYWNEEFDCYKGAANWNPLDDDGDALRLAVKLKITLGNYGCGCEAVSIDNKIHCDEFSSDNPYAATRRAIVRAAAEVGRDME